MFGCLYVCDKVFRQAKDFSTDVVETQKPRKQKQKQNAPVNTDNEKTDPGTAHCPARATAQPQSTTRFFRII
jgi:hypothetical protein